MTYTLPRNMTGWVYNHARDNYWRVATFYEIDDLIQDGLMICYKCLDRYGIPGIEIDEPHFMALIKSSFYNHIGGLLRDNRGAAEATIKIGDIAPAMSENDILERISMPEEVSDHDFVELLADMPMHLRQVVDLYMTEDGAKKMRKPFRARFGDKGETLSDRLAKLAGFPAALDFETELRAFLWERAAGLVRSEREERLFDAVCAMYGGALPDAV